MNLSSLIKKAVVYGLGVCLCTGCARHSTNGTVAASGTLEMTEVYLSPTVPGRIDVLSVHEGDLVKQGQRVCTLDRFDQSEKDYARAKRLHAEGGTTQEQLEKAELAWRDQQLISPIMGEVLLRVSEPGEVITPGIPAVVIGDPADVWIKIYIPERDIGHVVLGKSAQIHIDSFPDRVFTGRVTFISPKAEFTPKNIQTQEERVTQMFAVKITVDHPDGALKPGIPADCLIRIQ